MINLFEDLTRRKEILNCRTKISPNDVPRFLEKKRKILQDQELYPSGPRALSLPMLKRVSLIASFETGAKRKLEWDSSRQGLL